MNLPYNGPEKWACVILLSLHDDWDDKGEDAYLTAVHNSEPNSKLQETLSELCDDLNNLPDIQTFCLKTSATLRNCSSYFRGSPWKSLEPKQKAYTVSRILDYFLPEITAYRLDTRRLLQQAIERDPSLLAYAPDDFKTIDTLISPTTNKTNIMDHYSETPIATPTLVYGEDISIMDDEDLIAATGKIQARITKLQAIPGNSRKIARQIKEAQAALAKVVEALDADEKTE